MVKIRIRQCNRIVGETILWFRRVVARERRRSGGKMVCYRLGVGTGLGSFCRPCLVPTLDTLLFGLHGFTCCILHGMGTGMNRKRKMYDEQESEYRR
eukprot:3449953-Karenia_brevis.AAC.1